MAAYLPPACPLTPENFSLANLTPKTLLPPRPLIQQDPTLGKQRSAWGGWHFEEWFGIQGVEPRETNPGRVQDTDGDLEPEGVEPERVEAGDFELGDWAVEDSEIEDSEIEDSEIGAFDMFEPVGFVGVDLDAGFAVGFVFEFEFGFGFDIVGDALTDARGREPVTAPEPDRAGAP